MRRSGIWCWIDTRTCLQLQGSGSQPKYFLPRRAEIAGHGAELSVAYPRHALDHLMIRDVEFRGYRFNFQTYHNIHAGGDEPTVHGQKNNPKCPESFLKAGELFHV